jgi:hypothetical protein
MRCLSHEIEMTVDVDAFIERARKIVGKFENNPALSAEAREEANVLLWQFEEYLKARGLKDHTPRVLEKSCVQAPAIRA